MLQFPEGTVRAVFLPFGINCLYHINISPVPKIVPDCLIRYLGSMKSPHSPRIVLTYR